MRPVRDVMDTVLEDSGVVANAEQATDSDLGEVFRHGRRRLGGTDEANELRPEEHTSELQSLMRNSYAVFCLKTKKKKNKRTDRHTARQATRRATTETKEIR